jgi:hypothetical protein
MAFFQHPPDDRGLLYGTSADNEEGGDRPGPSQNIEQLRGKATVRSIIECERYALPDLWDGVGDSGSPWQCLFSPPGAEGLSGAPQTEHGD